MLLFLALTLTATVSSQAVTGSEIADGPGVCYNTRDVPYIDYENQEVSNTRKEWCWDVTKFFKCDVVYKHWEAVPVTKNRQITEKVCCEGYYSQDSACVAETFLLTETATPTVTPEPVKESNLWEILTASKGAAPEHTVEESAVATESTETNKSPDERSDDDLTMDDLELAQALFYKYHPVSSPVDDNGIVVTPVNDDNHDTDVNQEAMEKEVGGIVENELPPLVDTPTETPAPAAGTAVAADAAAASFPPTFNSAAAAESNSAALNAANAEVMAAEAIGIFAKELLKPLDALPSEAPAAVDIESHAEPIKPLDDPTQEHESASVVPTVAPESEEGSTPENRTSSPSNDDRSERGVSPLPLSPSPSVLLHSPSSPSSRHFPVIECTISGLTGFILCIILLISIASLSYVIYNRQRSSNCVITAHRPVVVP